jgi:hypothetical protein
MGAATRVTKVLALNVNGNMTYCTCPPELRGKGRCNHIEHQYEGETPQEFVSRVELLQERLSSNLPGDDAVDVDGFIPYEGTTIESKPYRMSDEELKGLVKIENRMQLDQNMDGGYMELEEPLWNDMDKNYFSQLSGMPYKTINGMLHGDVFLVTESNSNRFKVGRAFSKEKIEEYERDGYPEGWEESVKVETGVVAMNRFAHEKFNFEATKHVYVLPYYMRMGISDHTEVDSSAGDGSPIGEREDVVSSDITVGYKYMLRQHANPDRQQLAYDALLNNAKLGDNYARFSNGYRNMSLADEFAGKGGVFRAVLSGSSIPYSGRAVITPNADLKFGEVAIPPSMAVDIYRPTILKQLSAEGRSMEQIDQWMEQFRVPQNQVTEPARKDLERRIGHLRVAMNRQPSLHQSSFQSFIPRVSKGASAEIHPLYCKAYNADHDGDACSFYGFNSESIIPVVDRSIDANLEVNTRLPRHRETVAILPTKDSLFGLLSILEQRSEGEV